MGAQAKSNDFSPNCILVPAEGIWLITFIVALETCRCAPLVFMSVRWLVVHGEESKHCCWRAKIRE